MSAMCRSKSPGNAPLPLVGGEKRFHQSHKICPGKRLLQKMNRAQAGHMLALRGEIRRRQDDGAGIGMAGAQIVSELLRRIVGSIDI